MFDTNKDTKWTFHVRWAWHMYDKTSDITKCNANHPGSFRYWFWFYKYHLRNRRHLEIPWNRKGLVLTERLQKWKTSLLRWWNTLVESTFYCFNLFDMCNMHFSRNGVSFLPVLMLWGGLMVTHDSHMDVSYCSTQIGMIIWHRLHTWLLQHA